MRNTLPILAIATLFSSPAPAADLQSVYVAPGGVYVASGYVDVRGGPYVGPPAVLPPGVVPPGVVPPGVVPPTVVPPAIYGPDAVYPPPYYGPGPAYDLAPTGSIRRDTYYAIRGRAYVVPPGYAAQFPPRPPAPVPYSGNGRCIQNLGYGQWAYCD
jgi:hypothetical protein